MNTRSLRITLVTALLALPAPGTPLRAGVPAGDAGLGWHIADQGNRALRQIRAQALLSRPVLPDLGALRPAVAAAEAIAAAPLRARSADFFPVVLDDIQPAASRPRSKS